MKYLILGSQGMAGHMVSLYLNEKGHEVTGFARTKSLLVNTIVGDATNLPFLSETILNNDFDIIVNCIGILNQFAENKKSNAVFLNSFIPHYLADITKNKSTKIVHISTDCVFSGNTGPYTEYSFRDGNSFYDRSKALGELEDDKNITIRTSIIGPDIKPNGIGLLNWFMEQDGSINGYTKSMWTGQTTLQLAKTIEFIAGNKITGLYNMVPCTNISKYELLKLMNKHIRNNTVLIKPVDGVNLDKTLIRTKLDFDYSIPNYEIMIEELAEWMRQHRWLYPHYEII